MSVRIFGVVANADSGLSVDGEGGNMGLGWWIEAGESAMVVMVVGQTRGKLAPLTRRGRRGDWSSLLTF